MTLSARQHQWRGIMAMTEHMQALAEQEDWQTLVSTELERKALLVDFFARPVSADESALIAQGIESILRSDAELMQKGTNLKKEAENVLSKIAGSRKAIDAYHNCG